MPYIVSPWWPKIRILLGTHLTPRPLLQQRPPVYAFLGCGLGIEYDAHPEGTQLVPQLPALLRHGSAVVLPQRQSGIVQELLRDQRQHSRSVRVLGSQHLPDFGKQRVQLLVAVVVTALAQVALDRLAHLHLVQVPSVFIVNRRARSRIRGSTNCINFCGRKN